MLRMACRRYQGFEKSKEDLIQQLHKMKNGSPGEVDYHEVTFFFFYQIFPVYKFLQLFEEVCCRYKEDI